MKGAAGDTDTVRHSRLIRIFIVALGCLAIGWGLLVLPIFWRQSAIERTTGAIIAGKPYRTEPLLGQLAIADAAEKSTYCYPEALHSAAILRLRLMDEAVSAKDQEKVQSQLGPLTDSITASLSCSPADPFLWLVLYWAKGAQSGFSPDHLKYLRLSYRLGPNEGWIGLKRNPVVFALSEKTPADLKEYAINEFLGLLKSGFYQQAVETFTGPAWWMHDELLQRLQNVELRHRRIFASVLHAKGYDVTVPGIERPGSRPWR